MSRKTRLILFFLFGSLCGGLGLGILALKTYEKHETALILGQVQIQRSDMLDRLLRLKGESMTQFIYEYAQWTEVVDFIKAEEPDLKWVEDNLHSALEVFNSQAAWLYRPDGQLYYSVEFESFQQGEPAPTAPPFPLMESAFRENHQIHFFHEIDGALYEIRGSWVEHSVGLTPESTPKGYLLIGRKWDDLHLSRLSALTDSYVSFDTTRHSEKHHNEARTNFHLHRDLPDIHGQTLKTLDVYYRSAELALLAQSDNWEMIIFLGYGFLVILVVFIFTQHWVLRPLFKIKTSLANSTIEPVEYLLNEKAEFGQVARLIRRSFGDQDKLTESLDERARLGRDLHDGVIQTLYAAGMTMTSIRRNIRENPKLAEELIDQTRSELNATIRDVRHFISRLEPEDPVSLSFEQAVTSLLEFMQGGQDVAFRTDIDSELAAQIRVEIRANLLQIIREATSNAIRHGHCANLTVILKRESDSIRLEIADDGLGFDPQQNPTTGRGINNFQERAQELDATLDIISQPNQGARIIFKLPLISIS